MGLDIYAGTMTGYYAHNWKTAVQPTAERRFFSYVPSNESSFPHKYQVP